MAEYKHGSMDVTEQRKTFAGLLKASVWVAAISVIWLIGLAIFRT